MKIRGIASIVALLLLAACQPGLVTAEVEQTTAEVDRFSVFVEAVRIYKLDYEPASSPADLASRADLVVRGAIVGVEPGQAYAPVPGSPARIVTSVLHVAVSKVLAGDPDLVWNGMAYVEIPHPARLYAGEEDPQGRLYDLAAFAALVPKTEGVFFLDDRTKEPYWETIVDPGAGRPEGAPLMVSYAQGLLLADPGGRLVSVLVELDSMPSPWRAISTIDEVVAALTG
ncbi:MAG: hypothetical protein ACE5F5_06895 [Acidimicrobiia bacterium]